MLDCIMVMKLLLSRDAKDHTTNTTTNMTYYE